MLENGLEHKQTIFDMMKRSKIIVSVFTALILSMIAVSALGYTNICLREGETIYFSECNGDIPDKTCETTSCQLCTNEIDSEVYCPASLNACQEACIYIYEAPDEDPQEDPLPIILLEAPEDNSEAEIGDVEFIFNPSPYNELADCWLVIDGDQVEKESIVRSSNTIDYELEQGIYEWRVECVERDTYGGRMASSETRTVYVGEESPNAPKKVILTSPETGAQWTGAKEITFMFTVLDEVLDSEENCSFYLNDEEKSVISEVTADNQLNYNVAVVGGYNWKIACGTYESETRNFNIANPNPPPNPGGGGSPSTGGGGSPRVRKLNYAPTKGQMASGFTRNIKENDTIKFYVSNEEENETHTLTAGKVTENSIKIKIESDPINDELRVGQEKKFDLNSNGYYDLLIKVSSIANSKANLTVQTINEEIIEEEPEEVIEQTDNEEESTGVTGASIGISDRIKNSKTAIIVIAVIVIVIVAFFLSSGKKEKK